MAVHGEFCMFWMPSKEKSAGVEWTETLIHDDYKIEAGEGAEAPNVKNSVADKDSFIGIASIKPMISRFRTANPAPYSEESKKPDTGFSGIRLEVRLLMREVQIYTPQGQTSKETIRTRLISRLGRWFSEPNHLRGAFREGRIGVRIDARPEFNLVPKIDSGYKLTHFEVMHELKYAPTPTAYLILEHSGNPRELNFETGNRTAAAPI